MVLLALEALFWGSRKKIVWILAPPFPTKFLSKKKFWNLRGAVLFFAFQLSGYIGKASKKRIFYGQAGVGGGVAATSALTASKCEIFDFLIH